MILRSIAESIRAQNWFAVVLEFVIVVVGVFMGLQVQDWNDERKERIEERALLGRLYEETLGLIEAQREELAVLRENADVLIGINPVLFSQEPPRPLTSEECGQIASSHVYRRQADELPVLDEMLSTGRFDVLQDKGIKEQLRQYVLFRSRSRSHYQEVTNELFRLHSRFPELIALRRVPREADYAGIWTALVGEGFRWNLLCNTEGMRENTQFLNEYVDNLSRNSSMIRLTEQRWEHLEKLKSALSTKLGVVANADSPQ